MESDRVFFFDRTQLQQVRAIASQHREDQDNLAQARLDNLT